MCPAVAQVGEGRKMGILVGDGVEAVTMHKQAPNFSMTVVGFVPRAPRKNWACSAMEVGELSTSHLPRAVRGGGRQESIGRPAAQEFSAPLAGFNTGDAPTDPF